MKPAKDLTPAEVIDALKANDLRARVRAIFSRWSGAIEQIQQDAMERRHAGPVEWRRMELMAAEEIIAIVAGHAPRATGRDRAVELASLSFQRFLTRDEAGELAMLTKMGREPSEK